VSRGGLVLKDQRELAQHMNSLVFHTRIVDSVEELLAETSDLSIYWSVFTFHLSLCCYNHRAVLITQLRLSLMLHYFLTRPVLYLFFYRVIRAHHKGFKNFINS